MWALLLIVHTWNSSPLRSNLLRLQCTCCTIPTTSRRPHGSPLVWACQWPPSQHLWQGWSCGLVHYPGGNATDPIWRVLTSLNGISSWTPLKPQHSIPHWLSVQCEPLHVDHASAVKKGIIKSLWMDLSGLLGSGRASMLPLGTLSLGLSVLAVDPAFIAWHFSKFKTEFYCISFF